MVRVGEGGQKEGDGDWLSEVNKSRLLPPSGSDGDIVGCKVSAILQQDSAGLLGKGDWVWGVLAG